MFVTQHADHDTAVDGGVLRRDGEADMQTVCSDRQSSVPVESHTHSRGVLETSGPILLVRSLRHIGMMVSGLVSIEPSPRSCSFVTIIISNVAAEFGRHCMLPPVCIPDL